MANEYQKVRLAVSHGPDLHFDGKLLGEYTTQNRAGTKDRWTELRLWETPAGNWIAESVGCSSREREGEIRAAGVVEAAAGETYGEAVREAMQIWQWTTAAKAFARELGWDIIQRVD